MEKHIQEFNMSKIHGEQERRVNFNRSRNVMLQRAGEAALASAEEAKQKEIRERILLNQDELLANEMARRRREEESRRREIQRICESDQGLRELQRKLKAAYMNKERHLQVKKRAEDREVRRQDEAKLDARLERERIAALAEQEEKERRLRERSIQQARVNNEQITVKARIEREDAYNEFLRDKAAVEKIMLDIADEIREKEQARIEKKERFKRDMNEALEMRQREMERRKAEEIANNIAAAEYRQSQDLRKKKAEEKAKAAQLAAEKIFNKLKAEAERKRAEEERMRDAISLLRKEEADRRRDEVERRKREKEDKSRREMMEANEAQKRHKIERRAREMEEEQRLVGLMMEKFKEDERKEKMEILERHQAKLKFKMNILDQLEEKRALYEQMKAKEDETFRSARKEEVYRDRIIEEARKRLLMQHAAALKDFLPKGVLQKMSDLSIVRDDSKMDSVPSLAMGEYGDMRSSSDASRNDDDGFRNFSSRGPQRRVDFSETRDEGTTERAAGVKPRRTRPW